MPRKQSSIVKPYLLFVEGADEFYFFIEILNFLEIDSVQIVDMEGKDNTSDIIDIWLKTPRTVNIRAIGVVRDADQNPDGAFESVQGALRRNNLPVPTKVSEFVTGSISTGILILPSESEPGMLEDVCLRAVSDDPAIPCVDAYLACLQEKAPNPTRNMAKTRLHSLLASREEPGLKLGEAAKAKYFDLNHAAFESIKAFVQQLAAL